MGSFSIKNRNSTDTSDFSRSGQVSVYYSPNQTKPQTPSFVYDTDHSIIVTENSYYWCDLTASVVVKWKLSRLNGSTWSDITSWATGNETGRISVPSTEDIKLTVCWNPCYISVLNAGKGTNADPQEIESTPSASIGQQYGVATQTTTITAENKESSGYRFRGWGVANLGISSSTANPTILTFQYGNGAVRPFYDQVASHILTANATTGATIPATTGWTVSGITATKSVVEGSQYGTLPTPTKSGYEFYGWWDQQSGGTQVTAATLMGQADTTIWAHWSAKVYLITLNKNDGSGDTTTVSAQYDSPLSTITPPQRLGYEFLGYFDQVSSGTKYYNSDGTSAHIWDKDENNPELYAQWEAREYTITFDAEQGQSGGPTPKTVTYDGPLPSISSELPTKTGYDFTGYTDGDELLYYNASGTPQLQAYTVASDLILYVWFDPCQYTVLFDSNGGIGGPVSTTAEYDSPMPSGLPAPTKGGYDFKGYWYNDVRYYDSSMNPTSVWDIPSGGITLVARWEEPTPVTHTFVKVYDQTEQDWKEATVKVYKNGDWEPIFPKRWDGHDWVSTDPT